MQGCHLTLKVGGPAKMTQKEFSTPQPLYDTAAEGHITEAVGCPEKRPW